MKIWVDADACPVVIKEILYRAAERTMTLTTFVANQYLTLPNSKFISLLKVEAGFDVADNVIVDKTQQDDLVISSDIPLAAELIKRGAKVISFRGEEFTSENIGARLNIRDFMETMRASGINSSGPKPLSQTDKQQFANALDRILCQKPENNR